MVSPLWHKLFRDLGRMKGQVLAIAVVIAVGVMLQVMMSGLIASLTETRNAYYERYRLADVFAPVTRAPERMIERLSALPDVARAEGSVTGRALIDVPGMALPVQARAVSLPDRGRPALNDVYLKQGRTLDPRRDDEILLLESFAAAHGLRPGDRLPATMNGQRRIFRISGLAMSPEFLYTTAPGEIVPDDSRFGVVWMTRSSLEAAYDMDGAFNEALLALSRDANEPAVLDAVDRLLEPFGGTGAYGLEEQASNRFISEEIAGLRASSTAVPPIFLGVAAFLLYIVISRMVQSEREQIGLLKAFGYTDLEVGLHYFRMVVAIAAAGAAMGCILGVAAGRAMTGLYTQYYKFPFLVFELDPRSFVTGVTISILAASAVGLVVLRRVFAPALAAAMRPPAPPDFSRTGRIGVGLARRLDQPSRMVLRRIARNPGRMAGATVGIAAGMALSVAMIVLHAGFDRTIDLTFSVVDRSDLGVTFTHPIGDKALFELRRIKGVERAEPVRNVPVILRNGTQTHRGAITGLPARPELNRAIDADQNPIAMPENGLVLAAPLARMLQVRPGDRVLVEVREGRQPVLEIPVTAVAETLLGSPAWMEIGTLNRALGEPRRVSGAYLTIDEAQAGAIFSELDAMPTVAGVSLKSDAHDAFVDLMNSGAGASRYLMAAIAFIITFGIVYNAARIAFAERLRDLASLRVIGFTNGEAAFVLLGELAVVTLVALPLGAALGYGLSHAIAAGFSTELYQIPVVADPASFGNAMLVVLAAALISGWMVKRDLDRADLVESLKTRE